MSYQLCWIPGDGIGPEVTEVAINCLRQVLPRVQVVRADAGWEVFRRTGNSVPPATIEALQRCGAGLFGAVSSPSEKVAGYRSAILTLRQSLDLFANIRPIHGIWADNPRSGIRMQIVRENTEDLYVQCEELHGDTATAERRITRAASFRIGKYAARLAGQNDLPKITIVHKANILPVTDGLFRDSVRQAIAAGAAESGNEFIVEEMLVDIAALRLVESPERFQTIVTTNVFGDILSDLAAYWCGGMRRAPSLNWGAGAALAEPVHGSAPDIAGRNLADPTAAILSLALLCRVHWQLPQVANELEQIAEESHRSSDRTAV
jgi:homoisocitrate dehydrogenase